MADLIRCRLHVKGTPACVRAAMDAVRGESGAENELFSLESIVPRPAVVARGTRDGGWDHLILHYYGRDAYERYRAYMRQLDEQCRVETGYANWVEWSLGEWGTLQDVHETCPVADAPDQLLFCCVCSPPLQAFTALSARFSSVLFQVEYLNLDGKRAGRALFFDSDGCEDAFEWSSEEAEDLRQRLYVPFIFPFNETPDLDNFGDAPTPIIDVDGEM